LEICQYKINPYYINRINSNDLLSKLIVREYYFEKSSAFILKKEKKKPDYYGRKTS
jgi:hypothetical protein